MYKKQVKKASKSDRKNCSKVPIVSIGQSRNKTPEHQGQRLDEMDGNTNSNRQAIYADVESARRCLSQMAVLEGADSGTAIVNERESSQSDRANEMNTALRYEPLSLDEEGSAENGALNPNAQEFVPVTAKSMPFAYSADENADPIIKNLLSQLVISPGRISIVAELLDLYCFTRSDMIDERVKFTVNQLVEFAMGHNYSGDMTKYLLDYLHQKKPKSNDTKSVYDYFKENIESVVKIHGMILRLPVGPTQVRLLLCLCAYMIFPGNNDKLDTAYLTTTVFQLIDSLLKQKSLGNIRVISEVIIAVGKTLYATDAEKVDDIFEKMENIATKEPQVPEVMRIVGAMYRTKFTWDE